MPTFGGKSLTVTAFLIQEKGLSEHDSSTLIAQAGMLRTSNIQT